MAVGANIISSWVRQRVSCFFFGRKNSAVASRDRGAEKKQQGQQDSIHRSGSRSIGRGQLPSMLGAKEGGSWIGGAHRAMLCGNCCSRELCRFGTYGHAHDPDALVAFRHDGACGEEIS